jgi:uncharacterized membrane protein YgcG
MKLTWVRTVASAVIVTCLAASAVPAQEPAATASDQAAPQALQQFAPGQLDQMLAPIALYPDELLGQVLMAAGYPLEVVEADRWLQDPANAALTGDQLVAALGQQPWDPSVKSLVAFPKVLHMMDGQLDWTESLGEAFIDNPSAVMDEVQNLRGRAEAAGKLRTNAQEVVTDQGGVITIETASAQTVYVPNYQPAVVYGPWLYPDWPPYYFPGFWGDCAFDDFGYCWFGFPIVLPLWGWGPLGLGQAPPRRRPRPVHEPQSWPPAERRRRRLGTRSLPHRASVPYQSPSTRERFQGASSHPGGVESARGYESETRAYAPSNSRLPPAFESYDAGAGARIQAERGQSSRASMSSFGGFSHGGGGRGGGGGRR